MQRLFSAFPAGRPGAGLLLLRAAAGLALAAQGAASLADGSVAAWGRAAGAAALFTGALLLVGFLTPLATALAALDAVGAALWWLPPCIPALCEPAILFLAVIAAALFLLGPGAYSLDARWFGRREVVIPLRPDQIRPS